jgi:hypothetical protein
MITKLNEVVNHILHKNSCCSNSILHEEFHSCDFTENIWMKFFIQTNINVCVHKGFVKKNYHLKGNKNCVGDFVPKIHFVWLDGIKKRCPQNNIKCTPKKKTFSCSKCTNIVCFHIELKHGLLHVKEISIQKFSNLIQ